MSVRKVGFQHASEHRQCSKYSCVSSSDAPPPPLPRGDAHVRWQRRGTRDDGDATQHCVPVPALAAPSACNRQARADRQRDQREQLEHPEEPVLSVDVRCYISCVNTCLARNTRCNTMSHLSADAVFSYMSRAKCPM